MRASSLLAGLGLALSAAPLAAQQAGAPAAPPVIASKAAPPAAASGEPTLIFDREVFSYQGGRRDPYTPLVGKNDTGPASRT